MSYKNNTWQKICTRELNRCAERPGLKSSGRKWQAARRFLLSISTMADGTKVGRIIIADKDMSKSNYKCFDFSNTYFARCDLSDSRFISCKFHRTILVESSLSKIEIIRSDFDKSEIKQSCTGLDQIQFDSISNLSFKESSLGYLPAPVSSRANSDYKRHGNSGEIRSLLYKSWAKYTNHGRNVWSILSILIIWIALSSIVNLFAFRFLLQEKSWEVSNSILIAIQAIFGIDSSVELTSDALRYIFACEAIGGVSLIAICFSSITVRILRYAQDL